MSAQALMNRYIVKPCDNLGSVPGAKRGRQWDVLDTKEDDTDYVVATFDTRLEARVCARGLNKTTPRAAAAKP